MKNKIIYGVLCLVLLAGAAVFAKHLIDSKPEPKKDNAKHNIVYVQTEKATLTETETSMNYRGRMTSFDNVSLSAEVSGKILQGDVRFKAGESFKKGDVIVNIYSKDVEATLKSGKSTLLQTISQILPDLKVDYSDEYEKWMSFFNAIDADKPLPALPKTNSNKEKVFLAANNVLTTYYTLQQQEINLQRYTIIAPFDGSFKTVSKEIGAVSSPSSELATITRTDKLEITVPVWPSDLPFISEGDSVTISNTKGDEQFVTVSRIASFVDATSQSVNIYFTYYASEAAGFLEGEYVDVDFNSEILMGVQIPREALLNGNRVYLLKDGKLEAAKVEVLRQLDDYYVISGLPETALVVTESMASVNKSKEYQSR